TLLFSPITTPQKPQLRSARTNINVSFSIVNKLVRAKLRLRHASALSRIKRRYRHENCNSIVLAVFHVICNVESLVAYNLQLVNAKSLLRHLSVIKELMM